jgi:hypothetical protein
MAVIPPTRGMCRKFHGMPHSIPANPLGKLVEWKTKHYPDQPHSNRNGRPCRVGSSRTRARDRGTPLSGHTRTLAVEGFRCLDVVRLDGWRVGGRFIERKKRP